MHVAVAKSCFGEISGAASGLTRRQRAAKTTLAASSTDLDQTTSRTFRTDKPLLLPLSNPLYCMSENIQNLASYDPFADTGDDDKLVVENYVDIRVQQRNGRKCVTTIAGLPAELDPKRILKAFKKEFACNGTVVEDENMKKVIQLQGDHRLKIQHFLLTEGIVTKDKIKMHGF